MFDFLMSSRPQRDQSLEKRGLTPNDARALSGLREKEGRPIGLLAREWGCDPSNATWIVDRLERNGLAERQASPEDRRVKLVFLTARGARTMKEMLAEFHDPPAEMLKLSGEDLAQLERILKKLHAPGA
jgi:DNA-binding MarR family transcriptional regulator